MHSPSIGKKLVEALRQHVPGAATYGDDPDTAAVLDTWNATAARALARIECRSVAEVRGALRVAREFGVPMTVSGGRLDPHARANRDGHLVLDLRWMKSVSYGAEEGTVTAQGGTIVGGLLQALPDGVVAVTGNNAGIGLVGLTLGGGYGSLNGRFGLACDGLRGAQVVLADGEVVDASRGGDAELFWALRGGGTGFGVVTSLTLATHPLPRVLCAAISFPLPAARQALLAGQELLDAEPDQLGLLPLFTTGPDDQRTLVMAFVWSGEPARGEQWLRRLASCEGAQIVRQGLVPYRETLDPPDLWPWGKRWDSETQNLERLDASTVEALVEAAERMPLPGTMLFLHDFHGAPARVAPGATAFPLRENHFVAGIISSWGPGQEREADVRRAWIRETAARLAPMAHPGGYVNFLPPDQGERVRLFYGAAAERLRRIKKRLDPEDVFQASTGRFQMSEGDTLPAWQNGIVS